MSSMLSGLAITPPVRASRGSAGMQENRVLVVSGAGSPIVWAAAPRSASRPAARTATRSAGFGRPDVRVLPSAAGRPLPGQRPGERRAVARPRIEPGVRVLEDEPHGAAAGTAWDGDAAEFEGAHAAASESERAVSSTLATLSIAASPSTAAIPKAAAPAAGRRPSPPESTLTESAQDPYEPC